MFSLTDASGVLVWEAGVAAVEPIRAGRVFVDQQSGQRRTAVALVNPSTQPVTATLILRDATGLEVQRKSNEIFGAREHRARFVSELFTLPDTFTGSLTFETASSDQKLAAITLREIVSTGGTLYSTLPVVDLGATPNNLPIVFPHIAIGEGYVTQLVLINRSTSTVRGRIRLFGSDGNPLQLPSGAEFAYEIAGNGTYRTQLTSSASVQTGYAVVTLEQGESTPSGTAIFQLQQGSAATEAGVAAIAPTRSARIFVDNAATKTALAIASPDNPATTVVLKLLDRNGALIESASLDIPARGQRARFVHEFFPFLPEGFTGMLEINSTLPVVPITLKLTTNQRGTTILTTLPVADLLRAAATGALVFPQIALGGGFSTRLIFINTDTTGALAGNLRFFQSDGADLSVPLAGQSTSTSDYQIIAGGARQFRPGNTATVQQIIVDLHNPGTREIPVNQGNVLALSPVVIDNTGGTRDDFKLVFNSISSDVASVDGLGTVRGLAPGFSTLSISSASGAVASVTITVTSVSSGVSGYQITGLAHDLARRIYLTSTNSHTVLRAQDVSSAPELYAGVHQNGGLRNADRLDARFQSPAFLAYNQSEGSLYVSDAGNNLIRRVRPGSSGQVETVALDAPLNNPQGVVLDDRGNLWIADSGSHTIKRVNLSSGVVSTVAGQPGSPGSSDGTGSNARFRTPIGLAIEPEPLARQLERERTDAPPPPVSILVADSGNGLIRRVKESGVVETVGSPPASSLRKSDHRTRLTVPLTFKSPSCVAVDSIGNIYVSEPISGQVKTILTDGSVVAATQPGTFLAPRGIASRESGRVLVAESNRSVQQLVFGQPEISSITPQRVSSKGGDNITIKGKNFAPGTVLVIAGLLISNFTIADTKTITLSAPILPSGRTTLTIQNRGGLAQGSLLIDVVPLAQLPKGHITTVVGGSTFAGDGAPAVSANLSSPTRVTLDVAGNLFIVDTDNHRVRKVDARSGVITTVAGTGENQFYVDGVLAVAATLNNPSAATFDAAGNLYIADGYNGRIRKVDAASGIITTEVGGEYGFGGDGGPAKKAAIDLPLGIAIDASGNLYIADSFNHRIRRVDAKTQVITTVAGNGQPGYGGDNGPATAAALNYPAGLALDRAGNLLIADSYNHRIRRLNLANQTIVSVAGNGQADFSGDNGPATSAALNYPQDVTLDADGNLIIADLNFRIRKVNASNGIITTVAGGGDAGDGAAATQAVLDEPYGVVIDASGNLFIAERRSKRVRRVDAVSGIISTVAGPGLSDSLGDNAPAAAATLLLPSRIAFDAGGNLLIADTGNGRIRRVDSAGIITTVAGEATAPQGIGDGGPGLAASLSGPRGIAVGKQGDLYIADTWNHLIRRIDAKTGVITTIAGTGDQGFSGDGGSALAAQLSAPNAVTVDKDGNLLVVDIGNNRIRKIDLTSGIIRTVAGGGQPFFGIGDGLQATAALLNDPVSVVVDAAGNLFIADASHGLVRRVDPAGIITTVAGGGQEYDDNFPANQTRLLPADVVVDSAGNLFVVDFNRGAVRRIDAVTRIVTRVAGGEDPADRLGDNGPAVVARVSYPRSIALDGAGNLFIADTDIHRIRVVKGPLQ
ncbi:MAG: IPT/TIG domain-containing protein [Acidobacteriota bacterium]